jgi:5'-nucleotidase
MVMTGINAGSNLGDDVWYSGTVAAAMEGRFLGFPAVALSLTGDNYAHYETGGIVARQIMKHILAHPLPAKTILNVNIPDVHYEDLQGYAVTRLGTRHRAEPTIRQVDPRGQPIYWVGPAGSEQDAGAGTDFEAISRRFVSITPLRVDLTDYEAVDHLSGWVERLEANR